MKPYPDHVPLRRLWESVSGQAEMNAPEYLHVLEVEQKKARLN
jgi:hypothetical protein